MKRKKEERKKRKREEESEEKGRKVKDNRKEAIVINYCRIMNRKICQKFKKCTYLKVSKNVK